MSQVWPAPESTLEQLAADPRVTVRRSGHLRPEPGCVLYWMQRAQRPLDNPALDVAATIANQLRVPVLVFVGLIPQYPNSNLRHHAFFAAGVDEVGELLLRRGFGFHVAPFTAQTIARLAEEHRAALVIGDENYLREPEHWRVQVTRAVRIPFWTVDADAVVPTRLHTKEHFAARTIRPRILEQLDRFLVPVANAEPHVRWPSSHPVQLSESALRSSRIDRSVSPVTTFLPGPGAALSRLQSFIQHKLSGYVRDRNHPELDGTSGLSPYLHFGHIGALTVALAIRRAHAPQAARDAFLEQLIVRRELAINFVHTNPLYDSIESAEPWAARTLGEHAQDARPYRYTPQQLEAAETHDPLWNAAQKQMLLTGWMHNYMRMYWAKKILEWSPSPAQAFSTAVYLNDKYELCGRDPNGYAGIAWAITGKHDRPWFNRPVFGAVRSMSYESTRKKFDSQRYIDQVEALAGGASQPSLFP